VKISIVRGGGLAGMVTTTSLDTDDLTGPDKAALRAKVDQAAVHQSHRRGTERTPTQPDRFSYELTIEDNGRRQTLRIRDQDLSPELHDLITWVQNSPARRQEVRPPGQ
jgi:emfourin